MYLYVDKAEDLARVPEALLKKFGKPEHAMVLLLHPERKLARVNVTQVLNAIGEQGFFLQMPPSASGDEYMKELHQKNSKMGG